MKHTNNPKRSRPRSGGKRHSPNRGGGGYDSAGQEGKLRGSPQQVLDKYLVLARDAMTAGDRITCEGYYQHAEHFYRVINADGNRQRNNNQPSREQVRRDSSQCSPEQQPQNSQEGQTEGRPTAQVEVALPAQADQSQPVLDLQPQLQSEEKPKKVDAERPKRLRRPRRKSAEAKKINVIKEEASKLDISPVQAAAKKPVAAAS